MVEAARWAMKAQVRKIIHLQFIVAIIACRWSERLRGKTMTLRKSMSGSMTALAGATMTLLAVTSVEAAMLPSPAAGLSTSEVQLAAEACGAGFHRNTAGICIHNAIHTAMPRRYCQPGMHAISHPNRAGYRCVPN